MANLFSRLTHQRPKHSTVFNGQDLKKALLAGHAWLEQHREAINALNVFPVPDGDTGTNMCLTMRAATKDIANLEEISASVIAEKCSRSALMGARGNSGVILSQILRGLSQGLNGKTTFTAQDFAAAYQEAAKLAYRAVIKPVEGTILTVVRESAAEAQISAAQGADLTTMLGDTVLAAKATLARTPDLLPILKQAGVVDAGGQGLTTILEGMWRYARGEPVQLSHHELYEELGDIHRGNVTSIDEEYGYEVVFLLNGEHLDLETIRDTITKMGGVSTVVAGDTKLLKVHTHTQKPGQILDYGVSLGSLQDINIENLQEQSLRYAAESAREHGLSARHGTVSTSAAPGNGTAVISPPSLAATPPGQTGDMATVAVAAGDGWTRVLQSLGVSVVVPGGQTMNPSTQDLLQAVESCPASQVFLLPNNSNIVMSARQVTGLTRKQVRVIPTESLPQGVGALLAFNQTADFEANGNAMERASKQVQTAEITRAVRSVQIDGVDVSEGDIIGLVNNRLVTSGAEMETVVFSTLQQMNAGNFEIITLYYGADVSLESANRMAQLIKERYPALEIEVVEGGQPFYAYIISAE